MWRHDSWFVQSPWSQASHHISTRISENTFSSKPSQLNDPYQLEAPCYTTPTLYHTVKSSNPSLQRVSCSLWTGPNSKPETLLPVKDIHIRPHPLSNSKGRSYTLDTSHKTLRTKLLVVHNNWVCYLSMVVY